MKALPLLLAVLACFLAAPTRADDEPTSLQEMLDLAVNDYKVVGIQAQSFVGADFTLSAGQSGERIYGLGTPIGPSDQWIMGSNTKSMVSTVAAKVVTAGLIEWTTTAKEVFHDTGLVDVNPGYWNSTLELFLSHGSGAPGLYPFQTDFLDLQDYMFNRTSWEPGYDNRPVRLQLCEDILEAAPYQALYQFEYSLGGYTIAAHMLERVTGKTFEQLTTELLFEPLGMAEGCGFGPTTLDPTELPPTQPWGHLTDSLGYNILATPPGPFANIASAMVPDGGFKCSLKAWQRYLVAHMENDESFLPAAQWERLHTPIVANFYGFGWFISQDPTAGLVLSHGGTDGHNFANCILVPRFHVGVNLGLNSAAGEGSLGNMGYQKTLMWIITHPSRQLVEERGYDTGAMVQAVEKANAFLSEYVLKKAN